MDPVRLATDERVMLMDAVLKQHNTSKAPSCT
jgi:hypothetical protein